MSSFVTERKKEKVVASVMEPIVIHSTENLLDLGGFLLQDGDGIELLIIGTWVSGILSRDRRGWYLQTSSQVGIRLKTGLVARLRSLTPQRVPWLPDDRHTEPSESVKTVDI